MCSPNRVIIRNAQFVLTAFFNVPSLTWPNYDICVANPIMWALKWLSHLIIDSTFWKYGINILILICSRNLETLVCCEFVGSNPTVLNQYITILTLYLKKKWYTRSYSLHMLNDHIFICISSTLIWTFSFNLI